MPTLASSHIFRSIPKQGPELSQAIMVSIVVFHMWSGAKLPPILCHWGPSMFLLWHPHPPLGTSWHHTRAERPLYLVNVSWLFEQSWLLDLSLIPADGPIFYAVLLARSSSNFWDFHNLQRQQESVWLNELLLCHCLLSGRQPYLYKEKQSWTDWTA
jgi:hypothetical protein